MPIICPKCGTSNVDGATFCASCGSALTSAPPPAGAPPPYGSSPPYGSAPKADYSFGGAISSAIALVRNPVGFMMVNRDTPATRNQILINYVGVLAAITFIATLIGDIIVYSVLGIYGYGGLAIAGAFVGAILAYILYVIGVFVVGIIIKSLASNFRSQPNDINALKLSSYMFTPFFLASIAYIIPIVGGFIAFLGLLYGLYILYKGLPIMMATPQDQQLTYTIVTVIVSIVVFVIIGVIVGIIAAVIVGAAIGFGYIL